MEDERLVDKSELENLENEKVGLLEENIVSINIKPSGEDLLELAKIYEKLGNFSNDISKLTPMYLRKSQAENDLDKKIKKVK